VCEVKFAGRDGFAYAVAARGCGKLMLLKDTLKLTAA